MSRIKIPGLWRLERLKNAIVQRLRAHSWIAQRFSDPAAHEGMLLDTQRCEAYREALRRTVRSGDIVVDLGAGTGLLSLFASEAGAQHVYAIEMSAIADVAEKTIAANHLQDRITLIRRKSTQVSLPQRCDLLVSETLSILGFDTENMIEFIEDAKQRMLTPNGQVIPQASDTYLMPVQSDAFGLGALPGNMYGFDFSALRRARYTRRPIRLEVSGKPRLELAEPVRQWHLDFTNKPQQPEAAVFDFIIQHEGRLDGFLGWFEAVLCPGVTLSNSPRLPATSWSQIYFPTYEQPMVHPGQRLSLTLDPRIVAGWPQWSYHYDIR